MEQELKEVLVVGSFQVENYQEIKNELEVALAEFSTTYTDVKKAKEDKAKLNNLAKSINQRRIDLEKKYLEPFNVGKEQCNKLIEIIKTTSNKIDEFVKAEEAKEDEIKRNAINDIWKSIGCDLVTLEQLWNTKWLNKGCGLLEIKKEMEERIKEIKGNLKLLNEISPNKDDVLKLKTKYLTCLNLEQTINQYQLEKAQELKVLAEEKTTPELVYEEEVEIIVSLRGSQSIIEKYLEKLNDLGIEIDRLT